VAEHGEDDRDDREDPEPGDDDHLVAKWCGRRCGASLWLRDREEMRGGER
jgi:hypothetical protein